MNKTLLFISGTIATMLAAMFAVQAIAMFEYLKFEQVTFLFILFTNAYWVICILAAAVLFYMSRRAAVSPGDMGDLKSWIRMSGLISIIVGFPLIIEGLVNMIAENHTAIPWKEIMAPVVMLLQGLLLLIKAREISVWLAGSCD